MFDDFPLLKKCIYLNTAYVGLMSQSLYDFRRKYDLDYINKGDHVYMSKHKIVNKARISISKFFGSKINQTFVSSNFSSSPLKPSITGTSQAGSSLLRWCQAQINPLTSTTG